MDNLTNLNLNYWFLQTVAMLITAALLPNLRVTSIFGAVLIVIALAFVNSKVWDAALFFQIPDTLSYQSLMLFLANGIIFWILLKIIPGMEVDGLLPALLAPIVFTMTSVLIAQFAPHINWMAILDKIIELLHQLRDYFQNNIHPPPGKEIVSGAKS